jgi:hypothetical protein
MRTYLLIALGSVAGLFAMTGAAAEAIDPAMSNGPQLAQNTGAADRTLGNSSMGLGEGIKRLPERPDEDRDEGEGQRTHKTYDESGHGDNDTDMEHRPRRTLNDRNDD